MRRRLFATLAATFFLLNLSAQKGQPGMGKIDKADLDMKECDFDPGAEAVKLIEDAEARLRELVDRSDCGADIDQINAFMVDAHTAHWDSFRA